jgi:hypothetical protein
MTKDDELNNLFCPCGESWISARVASYRRSDIALSSTPELLEPRCWAFWLHDCGRRKNFACVIKVQMMNASSLLQHARGFQSEHDISLGYVHQEKLKTTWISLTSRILSNVRENTVKRSQPPLYGRRGLETCILYASCRPFGVIYSSTCACQCKSRLLHID